MPRILRGEGAEGTKGGRETSRGSAGCRSQSLASSEGRRQAAEDREPAPRQAAALTGRRGRRGRGGGPAGACRSRACGVDAEAALEVERSSERPRDQTTGARERRAEQSAGRARAGTGRSRGGRWPERAAPTAPSGAGRAPAPHAGRQVAGPPSFLLPLAQASARSRDKQSSVNRLFFSESPVGFLHNRQQ